MILEARYTGPFPRVTVPGYQHRVAERGEDGKFPVVKIRIPEGRPLGGWEIVKGKKAYDAGLKAAQEKLEAEAREMAEKRKAIADAELKRLDELAEVGEPAANKPKPVKKGAKP